MSSDTTKMTGCSLVIFFCKLNVVSSRSHGDGTVLLFQVSLQGVCTGGPSMALLCNHAPRDTKAFCSCGRASSVDRALILGQGTVVSMHAVVCSKVCGGEGRRIAGVAC